MPGLYSLVHCDGKYFTALLDEEANACNAGYVYANNARLALSFNSMVPDILNQAGRLWSKAALFL
jgi:hypothetical protein